jgi:hypothetical protein
LGLVEHTAVQDYWDRQLLFEVKDDRVCFSVVGLENQRGIVIRKEDLDRFLGVVEDAISICRIETK